MSDTLIILCVLAAVVVFQALASAMNQARMVKLTHDVTNKFCAMAETKTIEPLLNAPRPAEPHAPIRTGQIVDDEPAPGMNGAQWDESHARDLNAEIADKDRI